MNAHAIARMPSAEVGDDVEDSEEQEQRDDRERTHLGLPRHGPAYWRFGPKCLAAKRPSDGLVAILL